MTRELTKGAVLPLLIKFTIPLVLGNLFQLTYNAVDAIIVGRYVGADALAAVGVCNPVTTLMILLLNGLCIGAAVLMGTQYGKGDHETLRRQVSTTLLAGIIFSVTIAVLCIIGARPILKSLRTDPSIMDIAVRYLRIILTGLIFTFLYNFYSSTLRALGDSYTPLFFLVASAMLNIAGDLIFVVLLHAGSDGCAVATVLSEILCCLGCSLYIRKKVPVIYIRKNELKIDRSLLKDTVSYGWASAMQQGTVQMGKIAVQAVVNTIGVAVAAAFTAVSRIDDFTYIPQQNIAHAMTAFMAQNRGAGEHRRVREGFLKGMMLELAYGLAVFAICSLFAVPLMKLFIGNISQDAAGVANALTGAAGADPGAGVISHGVAYLKLIAPMYLLPAMTNGIQGYFRGMGRLKITLVSSFTNMGVRVLAAIVLVSRFGFGIEALPWSYFAGWIAMLIVELPLLLVSLGRRKTGEQ
ncbi:MAG: MATE family efflux transporter [Lachnospiraceae bacterium]|nr:MATE family efflux transporter [Lachnospiraceae bacterium]